MTTPSIQQTDSLSDPSLNSVYHIIGANSAEGSNATLAAISPGLAQAYNEFQKLEKNLTGQRIRQYQSEIDALAQEIRMVKEETVRQVAVSELKQNEIVAKKQKLVEVQTGIRVTAVNPVPVSLGTLFVIFLTLFLFIFYGSTVFSAFFAKELQNGIIALDWFKKARLQGSGTVMTVLLFPTVFLSLGFLIHTFLKKQKYGPIIALVLITLVFDFVLAYLIVNKSHDWTNTLRMKNALATIPWKMSLAFTDIKFYAVLATGFVTYVIWGVLLNYIFDGWESLKPDYIQEMEAGRLTQEILDLTDQLAKLQGQIDTAEEKIAQLGITKSDRQKKVNILTGGGIVIDISALRSMVGSFMDGWNSFISYKWKLEPNMIADKIDRSNKEADRWLTSIENNLN